MDKKFRLDQIQPNPFRRAEHNPLQAEKVAHLRWSIRKFGFWENILAREVDGYAELAYGHHRLAALIEEYGPSHEINLNIEDISNERMIKIMAYDNSPVWGNSFDMVLRSIMVIVENYAAGIIDLRQPSARTKEANIRYAPSCIPGGKGSREGRPYTVQTAAESVGCLRPNGRAKKKMTSVFRALELIERGVLTFETFEGLNVTQADAVIRVTRAAERREEAKRVDREYAVQSQRDAETIAKVKVEDEALQKVDVEAKWRRIDNGATN